MLMLRRVPQLVHVPIAQDEVHPRWILIPQAQQVVQESDVEVSSVAHVAAIDQLGVIHCMKTSIAAAF